MSHLSDDQKRQIIQGNLSQFAVEAYGHMLNRQVALAKNDLESVVAANVALETIAIATATYQVELDALDGVISDPSVYIQELSESYGYNDGVGTTLDSGVQGNQGPQEPDVINP